MPITIRPLTLDDYDQVRSLWERSPGVGLDESDSREGIRFFLERNPDLSLVALAGERLVGAVLCGHDGRRGYIAHLAVADEARRQGIGRKLVDECLERLARLGIVKCNLRMYRDNGSAEKFWQRTGWIDRDDVRVMTAFTPRATDRSDPRGTARGAKTTSGAREVGRTGCRVFQVDAFSDRAFAGNPAAVVLLDEEAPGDEAAETGWMQRVAAEMNLSETAFVRRLPSAEDEPLFELRWFTPRVEVDLCGHATLAAAHVLRQAAGACGEGGIAFQTRSGILRAMPEGDGWEMDFPATPPRVAEPPRELLDALGTQARYAGRSRFDYLVEVESEEQLRALSPDFSRLARVDARGIIVTSRSANDTCDFLSRFFAPACGIDEDPVTGSAHCCLGPFWAERLGRDTLVGHQASPRGGRVRVRMQGDRVWLGGNAVTVLEGVLKPAVQDL